VFNSYPGHSATAYNLADGAEWNIRPYRDGDLPSIVTLLNTADAVDKLDEGTSEEELFSKFQNPSSDPARQVIVVDGPRLPGMSTDSLLGYGRINFQDDLKASERVYGTPRVIVHPAARGRGLEEAVARRLLEMARDNERRTDLPHMRKARVRAFVREQNTTTRSLWEGFGLRPTRQFWDMARSLHDPIDEPQCIDGVNIRNFRRPQDYEPARIAYNLAFTDHWDNLAESEDEWNYYMSTPSVKPDLSWVAEVEDEPGTIAGLCICTIYDSENLRGCRREGWIAELGTIRERRRKGLGRALLLHGLHSLRSAGLETALLGVDSQSLTGAQRLYESVGFRIRDRDLQYECPLDDVLI